MLRKFHQKRESEKGFTLIELLVVILIIAILAAIAIPVFLRQREKGWVSQAESALKNAATAQQSYATTNNGSYCASTGVDNPTCLTDEGFRPVSDAPVRITSASATAYCLTVDHAKLGTAPGVDYSYSSSSGKPQPGNC
jgi:type IV pilus assembly protein PilA